MNLLVYLHLAFGIWMLVDALRRRSAFYWYLIIIFVPFGALLYFFAVKLRGEAPQLTDPRNLETTPDPDQLKARAQETPSVNNRLEWADALVTRERYAEAIPIYSELIERYPENKEALHGLGRAYLGAGEPQRAVEALDTLLHLDNSFRDYRPALDYAEALWQADRKPEAAELLSGLVRQSPRIYHRVALAHYLWLLSRQSEAKEQLHAALKDYQDAPDYIQSRDRLWAERARRMLVQGTE